MPTEMGGETVEIITMAMDKFQGTKNYEVSITVMIPYIISEYFKNIIEFIFPFDFGMSNDIGSCTADKKHVR